MEKSEMAVSENSEVRVWDEKFSVGKLFSIWNENVTEILTNELWKLSNFLVIKFIKAKTTIPCYWSSGHCFLQRKVVSNSRDPKLPSLDFLVAESSNSVSRHFLARNSTFRNWRVMVERPFGACQCDWRGIHAQTCNARNRNKNQTGNGVKQQKNQQSMGSLMIAV